MRYRGSLGFLRSNSNPTVHGSAHTLVLTAVRDPTGELRATYEYTVGPETLTLTAGGVTETYLRGPLVPSP
jgi:hypothetical protein